MSYLSSRFFTARYFGALFFGVPAELIQVGGKMGDPLALRAWYGGLLTNIITAVDLATLLRDLYTGLPAPVTIPDICAAQLKLLAPAANSVNILIGDEQLSITNYGDSLAAGGRTEWGPFVNSKIPLASIFVMAADGTTAVSLGIQAFEG